MDKGKDQKSSYPRPGPIGGLLIRKVIQHLRSFGIEIPITTDILIAVSGGPDSVALAHILIKYGRRIVPINHIHLLHINHGWRPIGAKNEERLVAELADKYSLPFKTIATSPPDIKGNSWEDIARKARQKIFQQEANRLGAVVFTAHHADDLAETLLWRLFTGACSEQGGGILVRSGIQVRPFLSIRKRMLKMYLEEEGQRWIEDETNQNLRFLRAKMRTRIIPLIEEIFPRSVEHLTKIALRLQLENLERESMETYLTEKPLGPDLLFGMTRARIRRAHWEMIQNGLTKSQDWTGEVTLPGGWKIRREFYRRKERWILEKR